MTVRIEPEPHLLRLSAPPNFKGRLRPIPAGIIPSGYHGEFEEGEVNYRVDDYRSRPGHTSGAKISAGVGKDILLDPNRQSIELNHIVFSWAPSDTK